MTEHESDVTQWVVPDVSYVDPRRRSCDCCGRPIARRYWIEIVEGDEHTFCSPEHAELYRTYWLPTHGQPMDA